MIDNGLRYLTQISFRRARAGSHVWMTTAIVAVGLRALRRVARNEPEIVYRTRVQPGDSFRITTRVPE
ncbi:MAG: hypothetical protein SGJ13_04300 [Actinomycetota bacterium]|nr:hypothetical protein [Actinomycetota bacterium]